MKIVAIDIETAPICKYNELSEELKEIWDKKVKNRFNEFETSELKYENNASFFSLFTKIICISMGDVSNNRIKSYVGEEVDILNNFKTDFESVEKIDKITLVGHNINNFDIPFILQRLLINSIKISWFYKTMTCKPWELQSYDTMNLWKATSQEWYSLEYICKCLNIESPKNELQGSGVAEAFYNGEINKIKEYCERDVQAVKLVFNKLNI